MNITGCAGIEKRHTKAKVTTTFLGQPGRCVPLSYDPMTEA
jgi:hypothetical protein